MSDLTRKTRDSYGVQCFLHKHGFDISGGGIKLNNIMVEFLKEKKLPYVKWNHKYKGLRTADLYNGETIQEHWKEFRGWVLNKKASATNDKTQET
jgi:hypothetical protein